jgi:hypothetical protein
VAEPHGYGRKMSDTTCPSAASVQIHHCPSLRARLPMKLLASVPLVVQGLAPYWMGVLVTRTSGSTHASWDDRYRRMPRPDDAIVACATSWEMCLLAVQR